ncbi:MAG: rod shape-determining protein MreD [Candidatus Omnitrophota bacterium]
MKINNWAFFATIFLFGIMQSAALDYLSLLGARPDLLVLAVIFFSLYCEQPHGLKAALLAGVFRDITSNAVFGSYTFGFCLCALFLGRYGSNFYKQRITTQITLCACLYFAMSFIILFINSALMKNAEIQFTVYFWIITRAAIYTACVSPLVFFVLAKIFRIRIRYA